MTTTKVATDSTQSNYIKSWYDRNTTLKRSKETNQKKYERGMFISISNNETYYETLYSQFIDQYISILKAIKGDKYKVSKWDIKKLKGIIDKDRIKLPTQEELLRVCANETPIMLCGVHHYRPDDIRSKGKSYQHSHFYIYNIHQHLPSNPIELRRVEDRIEKMLGRYTNTTTNKRVQDIVRLTEVGVGKFQYTDAVTPITLSSYLRSPLTKTHQDNIINYIANNRHCPKVQFPLTLIYLKKKL